MSKKSQSSPANFETAVAELEAIVSQMESGNLSLEASINAYKRGSELLKTCQQSLAEAEQQVKILNKNNKLVEFSVKNE